MMTRLKSGHVRTGEFLIIVAIVFLSTKNLLYFRTSSNAYTVDTQQNSFGKIKRSVII